MSNNATASQKNTLQNGDISVRTLNNYLQEQAPGSTLHADFIQGGPLNAPTWTAIITVNGIRYTSEGVTKKKAKSLAARQALIGLGKPLPSDQSLAAEDAATSTPDEAN